MRSLALIILILILTSCKKDGDGFTEFKVKAGRKWSFHLYSPTYNKSSLQFSFKINDTWKMGYTGGINKVAGIGAINHQENSCRLGVKDIDEGNEMYLYAYEDGIPHRIPIDTLGNGMYYCDIGYVGDEWHLTLEGKTYTCKAGKNFKIGEKLYPNLRNKINEDWIVPIKFY